MRLATKQDIEAPITDVFRILTDYEGWERAFMRRGAEVARVDKLNAPGAGMRWKTRFSYRSKVRDMEVELTQMEAPALLRFAGVSQSLEGVASLELMELGGKRTRMHMIIEFSPRGLAARLFLQSLRLARARLDRKFDQRAAQLAGEIEARYRTVKKY